MRKWIVFNLWLIVVVIGVLLITLQPIWQCDKAHDAVNDITAYSNQVLISRGNEAIEQWDLDGQRLKARYLLPGSGNVFKGAFTSDGKTALVGAFTERAYLLQDIQSGRVLYDIRYSTNDVLADAALSPDGKTITTVSIDRRDEHTITVSWRDTYDGTVLRRWQMENTIQDLRLSPDGKVLFILGTNSLNLWDTYSGVLLNTIQGSWLPSYHSVFSPDGQWLLIDDVASLDVSLLNVQTGTLLHRLSGHRAPIRIYAFSPDSKMVLTGSEDQTVILWDAQSGAMLHRLQSQGVVHIVAFSPDSQTLFVSSNAGSALWDAQTGQILRVLPDAKSVNVAVFSPDGQTLFWGGDSSMTLWDVQSGALKYSRPLSSLGNCTRGALVNNAAFSPDSQTVQIGLRGDDMVQLWDVQTGALRAMGPNDTHIFNWRYNPDAKMADFAPDGRVVLLAITGDCKLALLDMATYTIRWESDANDAGWPNTVFSPDHKWVMGSSYDRLELWDVQTGARVYAWSDQLLGIQPSFAIAPDSRTVGIVYRANEATLWDLPTSRQLQTLNAQVCNIVFTADSQAVLTSEKTTGLIQMWDARTGAPIRDFQAPPLSILPCLMMALSPDGKLLLLSQDKGVAVWDVQSGQYLYSLDTGKANVWITAFAPDSKVLFTRNLDGTAALWDTDSGAMIHQLLTGSTLITASAFSPDGRILLTGDNSGDVYLWDAHTGERLRPMCPLIIEPTPWRLAGGVLISLALVTAIITLQRMLH